MSTPSSILVTLMAYSSVTPFITSFGAIGIKTDTNLNTSPTLTVLPQHSWVVQDLPFVAWYSPTISRSGGIVSSLSSSIIQRYQTNGRSNKQRIHTAVETPVKKQHEKNRSKVEQSYKNKMVRYAEFFAVENFLI